MRGVVSLAAALAIPFTTASGAHFPHRDLILLITFGVIILTFVGQGLMLPSVIRWLKLGDHAEQERRQEREAELTARHAAIQAAHQRLIELSKEGKLSDQVFSLLRARHEVRAGQSPRNLSESVEAVSLSANLRVELIATERAALHELYREGKITDESRRRLERELDLEEERIVCRRDATEPPL